MGKKGTDGKNSLEVRYQRYRGILCELTMMSDVFMRNVLKDRACTEYILRIILEDSGLLDMNTLTPGQKFEELPESCVIFITLGDGLGYGCPIYHIKRKIAEVNQDFRDGSYIIYVNSKNQEDTPLGRLMHDFHCRFAGDMQSEILAKRVRELKETEKGAEIMCEEMDRIFREGRRLGEKRGEKRGERRGEMKSKRETAKRLADRGMTDSEIAEIVGADTQLVQKWLENRMEVLK